MANVTLIVPCLNQAPLLAATLDSALGQTYSDLALIIVDDGSTDESVAIAKRYVRAHPKRIGLIEQVGQGAAMSRDVGLERAKGDWIVILEPGDTLQPDALVSWIAYAQTNPTHSVIYSAWHDLTVDGESIRDNAPHTWTDDPIEGDTLATLVRSYNCMVGTALIYRSDLLKAGGFFDPEVSPAGEGWEHLFGYFRLLLSGHTFGYVPRVLVNTRQLARLRALDKETVARQRIATYTYALQTDQERMIAAIDQVAEKRSAQLDDAFEVIKIRNREVNELYSETAKARDYQASLEQSISEQKAQIETLTNRARTYQESLERSIRDQKVQIDSLLGEIDGARVYQAGQARQIEELSQEIEAMRKAQAGSKQRQLRDNSRPQQVSALLDHVEHIEAELTAYRATTSPDGEARLNELYAKWQQSQSELEAIRANPAFRLLGGRLLSRRADKKDS